MASFFAALCYLVCEHFFMEQRLSDFNHPFFIGIAGTGMSALAQYLTDMGMRVRGSDRYFKKGIFNESREKLSSMGISCFEQDGSGIDQLTDLVVISTAVEDSVPEVQKARQLQIPIVKRSELLAWITRSKKTIAVGGTSGKSTTSAMLFTIFQEAGLQPGIISGAGLVSLIREGRIGNAKMGQGDLLVIEADESDGSITQYEPDTGLLLNIDKDHQEIDELLRLFGIFRSHTMHLFAVNQSNALARTLSVNILHDFSIDENSQAGYVASNFKQSGLSISFNVNGQPFSLDTVGRHNMENALAATAVAHQIGVNLDICSRALSNYHGIFRRHQVLGKKKGVWVIDDYAHNPAKCASSIEACKGIGSRVIAWFQPHGYGPTRFLRDDFVKEFARVLRPEDQLWMSEIFYAGGTAEKNISSLDIIRELQALGKPAFFVENRDQLLQGVRPHLSQESVLLLMGARDPSLEEFAKIVWEDI
jgi:UDP-N-acetylmuramate--alanine ligase